ncbi:hypothetical protein SKAU_G00092460 [Synaphobranchus kaupii]|uniref:Ubiquitin-like protease family profile domain-containing protein n=1 Tax=Synaphobranchus kaupii TaxID=118154 RepID=A0A9Q1FWT2_SYNKA|nr:hypothetical protein SKAU_G00092460 [Synaphobranchus kaupii]
MVDNSVETVVGEESVSEDIERLDQIKAVVQDNVRKVQESTRRRLKSGAPKPDFKVGDQVLRQNVRSQQRKGGKLEANFLGPYIITALQGKSADLQGDRKHPHVILAKIGPYKLFYWDIARIGPNKELESEAINAYLSILIRKHNRQNPDAAAFIDSFAMTAIWDRKSSRLRIDPMAFKVIVGIVNEHHHWMLLVIYPQEKKSLFLDPMGESLANTKRCLETTR